MKKYLFIDGQLNGGGAERVLIEILRNFDYNANEVTLLQINAGGTLIDEVPSTVKVITAWSGYNWNYSVAYRCSNWFGWDNLIRKQLYATIKDQKFDVAISFLEGMPLKMHSLITDVADRNYTWVHCDLYNDRYEEKQFRKGEELAAYNKMDGVICVAKETANAFRMRFPNCCADIKVIYNPIDVERVVSLAGCNERESNIFTIVVCGRLTSPKRLDRVILLARRIKDSQLPIRILIVGDGELRNPLESQSKRLEVSDIVTFLGFQRNPFPILSKADLLLSTSAYEGFSLVLCEAMALGIPVVATKTSGPTEILGGNLYGLLCNHDDESIYQSVLQMYNDKKLRECYSIAGKERVSLYSVEQTMKDIYLL